MRPAVQTLSERPKNGREVGKRPYLARQLVDALERSVERLFIRSRQLIAATGFDEHAQEEIEEVQVLVCRREREWVDAEARIFEPDIQIGATKDARQRLIAAAEIEDEGERFILLRRL